MSPPEIIMPTIILLLSFICKLFIDRSATIPNFIESILELPVDITFFSISLIVGFTISPSGDPRTGMVWFAVYMIIAIIIVFFWRRSVHYFDSGSTKKTLFLCGLNYLSSLAILFNSIKLITGDSNGPV